MKIVKTSKGVGSQTLKECPKQQLHDSITEPYSTALSESIYTTQHTKHNTPIAKRYKWKNMVNRSKIRNDL